MVNQTPSLPSFPIPNKPLHHSSLAKMESSSLCFQDVNQHLHALLDLVVFIDLPLSFVVQICPLPQLDLFFHLQVHSQALHDSRLPEHVFLVFEFKEVLISTPLHFVQSDLTCHSSKPPILQSVIAWPTV